MKVSIKKGSMNYIDECEDILLNSELGIRYFPKEGSARKTLEGGFNNGEIYVALDSNDNCKGFIWFILEGAFHVFPYLNIVAVKKEDRKRGIGKKLLEFFEDICFVDYTKLFLVVADFNPDAKMLYERIGYLQVGIIPSLYQEGITEFLMMKTREEKA
jgi:ribosomal protein S18 acetylase RimI-like enzyme